MFEEHVSELSKFDTKTNKTNKTKQNKKNQNQNQNAIYFNITHWKQDIAVSKGWTLCSVYT